MTTPHWLDAKPHLPPPSPHDPTARDVIEDWIDRADAAAAAWRDLVTPADAAPDAGLRWRAFDLLAAHKGLERLRLDDDDARQLLDHLAALIDADRDRLSAWALQHPDPHALADGLRRVDDDDTRVVTPAEARAWITQVDDAELVLAATLDHPASDAAALALQDALLDAVGLLADMTWMTCAAASWVRASAAAMRRDLDDPELAATLLKFGRILRALEREHADDDPSDLHALLLSEARARSLQGV